MLVAAYNAAVFLPACLDSLVKQTHDDVEIIVIDDASTDDTAAVAASYPGVRLLRMAVNSGQAVARNEGLKHATGDYVTMVDADDWLAPDALERAVEAFDEETDCVLLDVMMVYPDREERYAVPPGPWSGAEAFHLSLDWTLHGLYVARAELYRRFPFDDSMRLFSDDNTTRLHYFASRRVSMCSGTYYYRQHEASMTHAHTMLRFDYMEANLSMRRWLDKLGAPREEVAFYEAHRWLNYIGMRWYRFQHRFDSEELDARMRRIYSTFRVEDVPPHVRRKFGYRHFRSYRLFCLQEFLYFTLRFYGYGVLRFLRLLVCFVYFDFFD